MEHRINFGCITYSILGVFTGNAMPIFHLIQTNTVTFRGLNKLLVTWTIENIYFYKRKTINNEIKITSGTTAEKIALHARSII